VAQVFLLASMNPQKWASMRVGRGPTPCGVAVIMYVVLYGSTPFLREADAELLSKVRRRNFPSTAPLQDEVDVAKKGMSGAKTQMAASAEKKVTAEGDLKVCAQELTNDKEVKKCLHQDCMSRGRDFEAETKSRGEELKTLAEAKAILKEATGEALTQTSLLQFNSVSREDSASLKVVHLVRDLAQKQNSRVLAQLAVKMSSALHSGLSNPFEKVKDLIIDMIDKLESEAGADASEKAYCDKELRESKAKKV